MTFEKPNSATESLWRFSTAVITTSVRALEDRSPAACPVPPATEPPGQRQSCAAPSFTEHTGPTSPLRDGWGKRSGTARSPLAANTHLHPLGVSRQGDMPWLYLYFHTASLCTGTWVTVVNRWRNQIVCPLLLICQKRTFCAALVTTAPPCTHLSTADPPLVYWALNLACYLWQIYD